MPFKNYLNESQKQLNNQIPLLLMWKILRFVDSNNKYMEKPKGYSTPKSAQFAQEKYFDHEQPLHLKYMRNYRVNQCAEDCDREQCMDYHSDQYYRRRPTMTFDGTWNYTPKICKNPQPCKNGDRCRFAHTKEECSYHPLVYKIHDCKFPSISKGNCSRWGFHCSYAHTDEDRRLKGTQQKKSLDFSLKNFKTEACEDIKCKMEDCMKYHDSLERRRDPAIYSYSAIPCNFVYTDFAFGSPDNCPNKDSCDLAHTKNEVYYHASMYKTRECKASPCYSKICAFTHPGEAFRGLEEVKEGFNEDQEFIKKILGAHIENNKETLEVNRIEHVEGSAKCDTAFRSASESMLDKIEGSKEEKSEITVNKLTCKQCREREIKWVFECGALSCDSCIGNICSLCQKKHITRLVI